METPRTDPRDDRGRDGPVDDAAPLLLDVTDMGGRGQGIARADGLVLFVPGAVAGDRVEVLIERRRARHAEARLLRVVRPSPSRVEPPCPVQAACGGCPFMPVAPAAALALKVRHLEQTLRRIGGVVLEAERVLASPLDLRYRGRVRFAVARAADARVPAYRAAGDPRRLVPVDDCAIGPPNAARAARSLLDACGSILPLDEVEVRASSDGTALLVVLHARTAPPRSRALRDAATRAVSEAGAITGVALVHGRGRGRRVVQLAGRPTVRVRIGEAELDVGASGFVQVNPGAAAALYDEVARTARAGSGGRVLDLYCGAGLAGLAAIRDGGVAHGIEADPASVRIGRAALARHPDGERVTLEREDAGRALDRFKAGHARFDVVLANPPRAGLGAETVRGIAALAPGRVILVSCDAATLARDLKAFAGLDWTAEALVAVDMFPATAHVEAIVRLVPASASRA